MKTLEKLYYGNILSNESCAKLNDEVKELLKLLNRNEDEFLKTLSDEQKIIFKKLMDCNREISEISERITFLCGFQLGARIL